MIQAISDASFQNEVVKSELPVVLNITADWCEPCKKLHPVIERVASSYQGSVKVCSLNVSQGPKTVSQFHVMSVPTLLFIRRGQVVGQMVGGAKATEIARKIESQFGVGPGGRSYAG